MSSFQEPKCREVVSLMWKCSTTELGDEDGYFLQADKFVVGIQHIVVCCILSYGQFPVVDRVWSLASQIKGVPAYTHKPLHNILRVE